MSDAAALAKWNWNGSEWTVIAPQLSQTGITYDPPMRCVKQMLLDGAPDSGEAWFRRRA
ncbi:hypothetical protein [Falsiroseomonas sp. E2-1-a4]|uniref:hypothetical protein n=1 Tax=Falsiroseomonas sp. E2-1-a4 TaxID=3239299 RepID=UPI003F34D44E